MKTSESYFPSDANATPGHDGHWAICGFPSADGVPTPHPESSL